MEPALSVRKAEPRTKVSKSIYVRTLRFPCLNFYYDLFYIGKNKVVPLNIEDLLTPLASSPFIRQHLNLNLKLLNNLIFKLS